MYSYCSKPTHVSHAETKEHYTNQCIHDTVEAHSCVDNSEKLERILASGHPLHLHLSTHPEANPDESEVMSP